MAIHLSQSFRNEYRKVPNISANRKQGSSSGRYSGARSKMRGTNCSDFFLIFATKQQKATKTFYGVLLPVGLALGVPDSSLFCSSLVLFLSAQGRLCPRPTLLRVHLFSRAALDVCVGHQLAAGPLHDSVKLFTSVHASGRLVFALLYRGVEKPNAAFR